MALHTLSLCTGEAGIELGLHVAGIDCRPVCYVEREAYAAANLARLIEAGALPDAPFWSDVRTLCDAKFRAFMEGVELDLLTGGYPCQPFSCAGKQRGTDDPRHLWPWIAQAIGAYRPGICFFENVAAHLRLGYPEVRAELRAMGYRVTQGLFTAGELGCGHRRERLFILAVDDATGDDQQWNTEQGGDEWHDDRHERTDTTTSIGGSGGDVADPGTASVFNAAAGRADKTSRASTARAGRDVADGQYRRAWAGEQGIEGDAPRHRRDRLADCGPAMADAECAIGRTGRAAGRQLDHDGDGIPTGRSEDSGGLECIRFPIFPPGPGELDRWARILADYPHLAPALEPGFRGLADGLSVDVGRHRSHQLRLHGNAVVPLVAAYAWVFLWADMLYGAEGR